MSDERGEMSDERREMRDERDDFHTTPIPRMNSVAVIENLLKQVELCPNNKGHHPKWEMLLERNHSQK
jgi:hypothetical protein